MSFPFRWLAERCSARRRDAAQPQRSSPPPGCCQSLVCYQERFLILFGGGSLYRFSNEVYVYDLGSRRWSCKQPENSDIVAPRLGHSAVIYGDTMIVYGGQDLHSPAVYDEVLELDLIHWRWTLLQRAPPFPDGPGARRLHNAHVVADSMYVLLGAPFEKDESQVWSLDLGTGVWRDMQPDIISNSTTSSTNWEGMLSSDSTQAHRLCGCCTAVSGSSIFVFGGYAIHSGDVDYPYDGYTYMQTLYEYNVLRNTWSLLRPARPFPLPPRRYAASMAVHQDYIYIFGGDANQQNEEWYFDDVWRIRIDNCSNINTLGVWECVEVAGVGPSPRSGCAYAYARSSLYLVGGEMGPMKVYHRESYSDEVYTLPLGYSYDLSLRDNAARWIGLPAGLQTTSSVCAAVWCYARLFLGARKALEPYIVR